MILAWLSRFNHIEECRRLHKQFNPITWFVSATCDCESMQPSKHDALTNAGSMLPRRRRWWANLKPALGQCIVFAGMALNLPLNR